MSVQLVINENSSFEEMLKFLEMCEVAKSANVTLEVMARLFEELSERDVALEYDVFKQCSNIGRRSVHLSVVDIVRGIEWIQVARRTSESKRLLLGSGSYALRETRRTDDNPEEAVRRLLREEMGGFALRDDEALDQTTPFEGQKKYPSDVYGGIPTVNTYTSFTLYTSRFATAGELRRGLKVVMDRKGKAASTGRKWKKDYLIPVPYLRGRT